MLSAKQKSEIGNRIRDYRITNRLKQESFAEKAGISVNFLSEIENGKRGFSIATLYNICRAYDISADYILFGKEDINIAVERILEQVNRFFEHIPKTMLNVFCECLISIINMLKM